MWINSKNIWQSIRALGGGDKLLFLYIAYDPHLQAAGRGRRFGIYTWLILEIGPPKELFVHWMALFDAEMAPESVY